MTTHNDNSGNFANRPKEEVCEIAAKGGKASHGSHKPHEEEDDNSKACTISEETSEKHLEGHGRNPDGTFTKGSVAAVEAGHKGGVNSHKHDHDHDASKSIDGANDEFSSHPPGPNPDGTFTKGSEAAAEAGHKGGQTSHKHDEAHSTKQEKGDESSHLPGRNPDGTFTQGSEAAAEAGHKGGQQSHKHDHDVSKAADGANDETDESSHLPGRNPDGTFTKGSHAASEAGHQGGQHSNKHGDEQVKQENEDKSSHLPGRNPDGTFTKGSQAAAEAGHIGGQHSHKRDDSKIDDSADTSGKDSSSHSHLPGRNPDGTFTKGSEAAAEAGHKGGQH